MTAAQFMSGLNDKLMGQVNLVLEGLKHVADGGSFTLTSGVLDRDPIRQGVNAAAVNGAHRCVRSGGGDRFAAGPTHQCGEPGAS